MPISDLLASITGEKPASTNANSAPIVSSAPKRKAQDEIGGPVNKAPRTIPVTTNGASRVNGHSGLPSPRLPENKRIPSTSGALPARPAPVSTARPPVKPVTGTTARTGTVSSAISIQKRPITSRPTSANGPSKTDPPKKKSFAEIMQRAKEADAMRASLGKIQHKPVERTMTMKERKELKAEEARNKKPGRRPAPGRSNGIGNALSRAGTNSSGPSKPGAIKGKETAPVEEKKVKKAVTATTGYTGTARPRPGALAAKAGGTKPSRDSEPSGPDRHRYPSALSGSRRHHESEDEMDDFIEYDDEEDVGPGYGRRGGYESMDEDESDMEAGISDIDQEERRAEVFARREDQEQEALEKKLKREKEERKRKQLMQISGKTGSR